MGKGKVVGVGGIKSSIVATPLWGKCEVATHTLENETWESSETHENSERKCRGQNTLYWGVIYIVRRLEV